jgi:hypothetical protein
MSRGTKITLLIVGGVMAIGLIVYFVFVPLFYTGQPTASNNDQNTNVPVLATNNSQPATNIPAPAEVSATVKQTAAARIIAQTFAVRLATYTNQNGLSNLSDLRTLVTPAVWSYLDGEYRTTLAKTLPPKNDYYAATGTAVNVTIAMASDTEATATVTLQKVETGSVSKTSYVTLNLKLKLVQGAWLVSWLEWGK